MSITTVNDSQWSILDDIRQLHNADEPFQVDLTFGNGNFWMNADVPVVRMGFDPGDGQYRTGFDQRPNLRADVRALPFRRDSVQSMVFDPPFVHAPGANSIMGNRFGGYPSQKALQEMYFAAGRQIAISLAPGGLLVWKCQDIVESGKQVWNHMFIYDTMHGFWGFEAIDLFVLLSRSQVRGHNHAGQQHARRAHSYFWVFRKPKTQTIARRAKLNHDPEVK